MGRSILAVVAGIVIWDVLWLTSNPLLMAIFPGSFTAAGGTSDPFLLALLIILGFLFGIPAGYVTARLAPNDITKHVWILALIQLPQGILVEILYWDLLPIWYHIGFLVLLVTGYLAGGKLRESQIGHET